MQKKTWLLILAGLCIIACIVFAAVGVYNTTHAASYEDLEAHGEVTFYAHAAAQEEDGTYTIYYTSEDGRFNYVREDVGQEEFDSYQFDVAVSMNEQIEEPPQSKIKRYVYTYRKDGEFMPAIYDSYKTLAEVSALIENANSVSSVRYYVFAGVLLLFGSYLMFMAWSRGKNQEQQKE